MTTDAKKYPGVYKGVVVSNVDVTGANRVMVRVEDVLGNDGCIWADPCQVPSFVEAERVFNSQAAEAAGGCA